MNSNIALFLAFTLSAWIGWGEAPSAELLKRLAAQEAVSRQLFEAASLQVTSVTEELGSDWKPTSTRSRRFKLIRADGVTKTEVLSGTKDGVDDTEAVRAKVAEQEKTPKASEIDLGLPSPFQSDMQSQYTFVVLGPDPNDASLTRIGFSPKGKKSPKIAYGDASIDEAAGETVRLSIRPSENPRFVDSLSLELRYEHKNTRGRLLSFLRGQGSGGILFFKKRMRNTSTFSNYRFDSE